MKKNIILVLLMSLSLVIFYGCSNPGSSDLPVSESSLPPATSAVPETGVIIITAKKDGVQCSATYYVTKTMKM